MPLKKLFNKRHSLKETSLTAEANKELEKLKSTKLETVKAQSESNLLMASDFVLDVPESKTESPICSPAVEEEISSKYEYIEQDREKNPFLENDFNSDIRRQSAPPESINRISCNEQSTSKLPKTRRKKCASESMADDLELNKKDDITRFHLDDGKLEDMIGKCINRIIKKSILTAVKNVNINGIYEEVIENISNQRLNSVDAGSNNEEKYSSDVAEYVDLDESGLYDRVEETEEEYNFDHEVDRKDKVSNSDDKRTDALNVDGYSADLEESISLHSNDIEFKDQIIVNDSVSDVTNVNENTISTQAVSEVTLVPNKEDEKIDAGCKLASPSSTVSQEAEEIISPTETESETTNMTDDIETAESFKERALSAQNCENDNQAQDLTDTPASINAEKKEADKCVAINNMSDGESNLMVVSDDMNSLPLPKLALSHRDSNDSVLDCDECLPYEQIIDSEEKKTNNWKIGYLRVKLPLKERGKKGHLKAWKKRCVSIQTDEFVNDPKNPCLMLSLYSAESGTARKHGATFWKSISGHKAAVYRSSSRSHKYAFTISDDNNVIIHLSAESETSSQEWIAAIRSILWPPSPVVQLEKMLYGKEFEISIIDNDFSFRAGLLGMYGYLTITGKKLILVHPSQGFVIQEWYLNTVDKFELIPQAKIEDAHKVLSMTTCSDSSTGKGELLMYCPEAVAMLQSIASTIHQILTVHIEQKGGKYDKELAEIAYWLVPAASQNEDGPEDYYKVPPRQVKSLLDIPNFIFNKPLTPSTTVSCVTGESMESKSLEIAKTNTTRASQDSGISTGNNSEDILNCSTSSFLVGGGQFPGKSSDSELSDSYTPPRSPIMGAKQKKAPTLQIP